MGVASDGFVNCSKNLVHNCRWREGVIWMYVEGERTGKGKGGEEAGG